MSPGAEGRSRRPDETSLTSLRDTDALLDVLAGRDGLAQLDGVRREDPLVAALAGWVEVIDAEVVEATAREARATRKGRGARRTGRGPVAGVAAGRVVPTRQGRDGRVPWWLLSASAAAVIAVMGVGAGLQDTSLFVPGSSTEQSVQSVESVLTAARLAAEAGDVAGAALLLERARAMVAELPAAEQAQFEVALEVVERGLRIAEEAVRRGEPVPPLPRPDLPGVTDPDGVVPSAGPDVPASARAVPDQPSPTRRPTDAPAPPADPGAPAGTAAPAGPTTPAPAPTPTTDPPTTPEEPAPRPTTAAPPPPAQPGRPAEPGRPTTKPAKPTTGATVAPTSRPTSKPTSKPTMNQAAKPTTRPTTRPTTGPTARPTQADADRAADRAPAGTAGEPADEDRTRTQTRRAAAPEQLPPAP